MPTFGIHRVKFDDEEATAIDRGVLSDRPTLTVGDRVKVEDRVSKEPVKRSATGQIWIECEVTLVGINEVHVRRLAP